MDHEATAQAERDELLRAIPTLMTMPVPAYELRELPGVVLPIIKPPGGA